MESLHLLWEMALGVFQVLWIIWPVWLVLGVLLLARIGLSLYRWRRLARSGIADLDRLDGQDFEKYLEMLFRKLGYRVTRTPYQGDFGADLVLEQDGQRTVVQAKRYKRAVGVKAIQEAVTAKEYYRCDSAMVVTNSHYSQQARKLARANHVELWDRERLVSAMLSVNSASEPEAEPAAASTLDPLAFHRRDIDAEPVPVQAPDPVCAICGNPVSPKVMEYCLSRPERFGGEVYCYEHQKRVRRQPV